MNTVQAYYKGREYFRKHCLQYGVIVRDERREDATGAHRKYVINIDGWQAHISMHNGVVVAACLAS
jgi:hypothetical protein